MSANKILDMAERQALLDAKVIAELRKQVAESKYVVTPEALAKVLVDHEHLTPFQARKLVAAALGEAPPLPEPLALFPPSPSPVAAPSRPAASDLDLGFADDPRVPSSAASAPAAPPAPPEDDIVMLEAVDPLPAPPKPVPAKPAPQQSVAAKPKPASPARPATGPSKGPKPAFTPADIAQIQMLPAAPVDDLFELDPLPATPVPVAPAAPVAKAKWSAPPSPARPAPPSDGLVPLDVLESMPARSAAPMSPPPLDDLFGSPLGPASDPLAAGGAMLGQPPVPAKVKKGKRNVWDSPLLLIGGGLLGVLVVAFGLLFYALTRGSAAEVFAKAEEEYRNSAYTGAIAAYDMFLAKYPKDPQASMARVRRGMAQLRQVTDGGQNPRQGLQTAKTVLPQIETEEKFNEARIELSTILPDIADGFALQAAEAGETAKKEELVKLADEAFGLVNNPAYLPASLRKEREGRIANILDRLKVAQRSILQDKDLAAALGKIAAAESQGNARQAYQVRKDLLKLYPGLDANSQLIAAIRKVGDKERQLVQVREEAVAAATDDLQPAGKRVVLSMREGPAPAEPTQIAFVLVEGAAYGIDVASGQVLWRRHVGYETVIPPLSVAKSDGADALLIDSRQHELLRLEATTGKLLWRHAIGQPFFRPVVFGDKVFVTVRDGRVLELAATDGNGVRSAQLPQGAPVAAGFDTRAARLVQPGEHSTLFVLGTGGLACEETFYLGHERGAILVPPVVVLDHVLAIESPADDHTLIHVLARSGDAKQLAEVGQPFRLKGRIVVPLSVVGKRVVAATDLGEIDVYEVDAANAQQPVRRIAHSAANEREATLSYHTADANRLWLASRRCSQFEIQSSLQKLSRKWSLHQDDSFVGPLQTFGQALVHLRRRVGLPGVSVEACRADDGSTIWKTDLAVPVAALVAAEPRKAVDAVTEQGRVFAISSEQLKAGYVDTPAFPLPRKAQGAIFPEISRSSDGAIAGWTETQAGGRAYSYDIASAASPASKPLPSTDITASTAGVLWRGQMVVPTKNGTVALVSPQAAGPASLPFMPPLEADNLPVWTRPAVLPDDSGFVIGDGLTTLYRVQSKTDAAGGSGASQPYLASALDKATEHRFQGALVAAGATIYGLARGGQRDAIVAIDPETLAAGTTWPLQGRAQFGPALVRDVVFVASEADGLLCLEAGQKLRWKQPLPHGPLAGPPVPCDNDFLALSQSGFVDRLSGDSGAVVGFADLAEPLGGAGHMVGPQLFVATSDGTVVMVSAPKPQ